MFHVIMAGGSGTRFWPRSRKGHPKQLIDLMGQGTLIRQTVDRIKEMDTANKIYIVASDFLCDKIKVEIPEIPESNFIKEPSGKNTAPAIGLAALHIYKKDPKGVMAIYPADHLIQGKEKFIGTMRAAEAMAEQENILMTIGIKPTYPATGYGYIQFGANGNSITESIYKVKTFAEKPHKDAAINFFESGEFLWNSGIFVWKAEQILLEMKTHMCELHDSLDVIFDNMDSPQYDIVLDREWEIISPESIDYGILEKAKNVYTVKADFEWSDLGTWDSLFKAFDKNEQGSLHDGEVVTVDSKNNLVISPNRLTALIGVEDLAVVNMMDVTLIMTKSESEKVKTIVKMLESMKKEDYL
ncbi:MAG: mannose-1-phosphate guanylyltransferase [Candidatus Marinimicrobia bacterium]|nr:mannose-1-phosphate guanylyltransferase [Candidatus Neomarinimicrobiota bacterium]